MRVLAAVLVMVAITAAATPTSRLEGIALDGARGPALELRLSGPVGVWAHALKREGGSHDRIFVDLDGAQLGPALPRQLPGSGPVVRVRAGQFSPTTVRVVLDLTEPLAFTVRRTGTVVTLQLRPTRAGATLEPAPPPPDRTPRPDAPPPAGGGTAADAPAVAAAAPGRDGAVPPTWPEPAAPAAPPPGPAPPPPAALPPAGGGVAIAPAPAPPAVSTAPPETPAAPPDRAPDVAPTVAAPPEPSGAPPPEPRADDVPPVTMPAPAAPPPRLAREPQPRWAPQPMWTPQVSRTTPPVVAVRGSTPTSALRPGVVPRATTPAGPARPVLVARASTPAERLPPPVPPSRHPTSPGTPPPTEPRTVVASRHPVSEQPFASAATPAASSHPASEPPVVVAARADTPRAPGPFVPPAEPSRTTTPRYEPPTVRASAPVDAFRFPIAPPVEIARATPPDGAAAAPDGAVPPPDGAVPPAAPAAPAVPPMPTPPPLVVIDAGHGGRDPGAAGIGGVLEKHVVLATAHRLAERLSARLPVTVLLTRTDDTFVPIDERLARQGEGAALFISLHANASTDGRASGIEVFYGGGALRTTSGPGGDDPRAARFGRYVAAALEARIGGLRGGARPGEFRVLTHNPTPGALVEIGYLTHHDEALLAQSEAYQSVLADALIDAVAAFLRGTAPVL